MWYIFEDLFRKRERDTKRDRIRKRKTDREKMEND